MHCTTDYPTAVEDVNLRAMVTMREAFKVPVGLSDHTTGSEAAIAAVALGAEFIENTSPLIETWKGRTIRHPCLQKSSRDMFVI